MKPLPILLLLAAGAVLLAIALRAPEPTYVAPRAVPRHLEAALPAGHARRAFDVTGMCCEGCSGRLHAAALEQPGVRSVAVRFEEGRLEALCAEHLDVAALAQVLSFDKYRVTPLP